MKRKNMLVRFLYAAILIFAGTGFSYAQDKEDKNEEKKTMLRSIIDTRNFKFIAQSATPMGGRFLNLNSPYDVRISGDTLMSDLPYFGRAFVAPIYPTESPLRFTSTDYEYQVKENKKGDKWDITIVPRNNKNVRQMFLSVGEKGYATLQVTSNTRQPISFNGYVTERKTSGSGGSASK